jgi:hypothetical protein
MALRLRNIPIRMTIGTVFALLFTDPVLREQVDRYEQAFGHYLNAQWAEAVALLEPLQREVGPQDPVVDRLLKHCQRLLTQPPTDDDWRCTHLSSK